MKRLFIPRGQVRVWAQDQDPGEGEVWVKLFRSQQFP